MSISSEFDPSSVPSPCYVVDLELLKHNLRLLREVRDRGGCKILLALKGFAMFGTFPLISQYLDGTCAGSLAEARLGSEEFGGETHVYAPAFTERDIEGLVPLVSHISFNSLCQWRRYASGIGPNLSCGLRINPEHSEAPVPLYDPCAPRSRFGVTAAQLQGANLEGLSGFHFHTLCEQTSDALERTLLAVEEKFAPWLKRLEWINFGGGHWITNPEYDREHLVDLIRKFRAKFKVRVYLEPGEAVAIHTGILVATVEDIIDNQGAIAILDTSATAHMPDVLEMPYLPRIIGAGQPGEFAHEYRLGGITCLAGDVIGNYSFPVPLEVGQKIVFDDMAHYTMVKTTTFNGVRLPAIATYDPAKEGHGVDIIREFGYADYKSRLS